MPEPVDRKNAEHPNRDEARREKRERVLRDREELGHARPEDREREQLEGVTQRREREAAEEAERIEQQDE